MLNVGQGEALFIESPTGAQVLVDGGPSRKILSELTRVMSPFDRSIDAIIITNPDADHIGGFVDVLKNYKIDKILEPGTFNNSRTYQNLKTQIKNKKIEEVLAQKGMRLNMGGGVKIDILFPDRDVSAWDPNDGSIIMKLFYGQVSVLLTGDATMKTEKIILDNLTENMLSSTILKVPHHGSRTSSSREFIQAVLPKYAMVSNGQNNKYGHPHQDTLDTLAEFGARVFRTDLLGTIIMQSNGQNVSFSYKK